MFNKLLYGAAAVTLASAALSAQDYQRRATMVGGGPGGGGGRCSVEVVVDSAVEVQINGDTATLRNLSGQPPQWRRFECTSRMPPNPAGFRFRGVDGRGHQELVSDPRNGGPVVVRIEDPQSGAEAYTFEIVWGGGSGGYTPNDRNYPPQVQTYPPQAGREPGYDRGNPVYVRDNGRFNPDQAFGICREEVQRQAAQRFGSGAIEFADVRMDDNPGRGDWILGRFFLRRDRDRDQSHQFVCSVNFDTGRVRSVEIDPIDRGRDRYSNNQAAPTGIRDAVQTCQREVERRVRDRGYRDVQFGEINIDDRSNRNDSVVGNLRADRDRFNFTCRVDLNDGDVRSVDLKRR